MVINARKIPGLYEGSKTVVVTKQPVTINYKQLFQLKRDRKKYIDFMKGKRVVLVGPAPSVIGSKQQEAVKESEALALSNQYSLANAKAYPLSLNCVYWAA